MVEIHLLQRCSVLRLYFVRIPFFFPFRAIEATVNHAKTLSFFYTTDPQQLTYFLLTIWAVWHARDNNLLSDPSHGPSCTCIHAHFLFLIFYFSSCPIYLFFPHRNAFKRKKRKEKSIWKHDQPAAFPIRPSEEDEHIAWVDALLNQTA